MLFGLCPAQLPRGAWWLAAVLVSLTEQGEAWTVAMQLACLVVPFRGTGAQKLPATRLGSMFCWSCQAGKQNPKTETCHPEAIESLPVHSPTGSPRHAPFRPHSVPAMLEGCAVQEHSPPPLPARKISSGSCGGIFLPNAVTDAATAKVASVAFPRSCR